MEILKVENLSFTYPLMTSPALCNVSFSVEKGEFIAVCGATGSGKSTLLRMLKRELCPVGERSGEIPCNIEFQLHYRGNAVARKDYRHFSFSRSPFKKSMPPASSVKMPSSCASKQCLRISVKYVPGDKPSAIKCLPRTSGFGVESFIFKASARDVSQSSVSRKSSLS